MRVTERFVESSTALIVAALLATAGCGESTLPGTDTGDGSVGNLEIGVPIDGAGGNGDFGPGLPQADFSLSTVDMMTGIGVGQGCPTGNECQAGLICLGPKLDPSLPAQGYCTRACVKDTDCGDGSFCGPPLPGAGNICWLRCGPNGTCGTPKQVCGRRLDGLIDLVNMSCLPGNPKATEGSPCKDYSDCNANQVCVNNPFEAKNGFCATVACSVGNNASCIPGNNPRCVPFGNTGICFSGCQVNADCRAAEGYHCDQVLGLCMYKIREPGAACALDGECGPAGSPWKCVTQLGLPGNVCGSIDCNPKDTSTCPDNSLCYTHLARNVCLRSCAGDGDCRLLEGYHCKPADPLTPLVKVCVP